ncbi:hypothetical protein UQW22_03055 [Isoptericola halotolerans]|uniref:hypothetical protein n=1 Tax=Isoptericola halotolerans TaxID=300560 RepID=UPI00388D5209
MSSARRPGFAPFAAPLLVSVAGGVLVVLGLVETWVVVAAGMLVAVAVGWWYQRALRRWHVRSAEELAALEATGRWTAYSLPDRPDAPDEARSFPKRAPLDTTVGHTYGQLLAARADRRQVWSLELGVQRRSVGTSHDGRPAEPMTSSDPFHVVLTHLDRGFGQVDVRAPGPADRWRPDVEVGVPGFDEKFVVRSESERTARQWLASGTGAELAREGAGVLHGGTLRLDGRTLLWWRAGHADLDVLDDVAQVVGRAASYLPR